MPLSRLALAAVALVALAQPVLGQTGRAEFVDPNSPRAWTTSVGFWMNAERLCGVRYDPQARAALTAQYAGYAGMSVPALLKRAEERAAVAAPHFTRDSCRFAKTQGERLGILAGRSSGRAETTAGERAGTRAPASPFSGKTNLSYDAGHGTQVSYHSPDGHTYLFYPGNQRILKGDWRMDTQRNGKPAICFRYGAGTYNPVLDTRGGDWECADLARFQRVVKESAEGDILGLRRGGAVPFVLSNERTTLRALSLRIGSR